MTAHGAGFNPRRVTTGCRLLLKAAFRQETPLNAKISTRPAKILLHPVALQRAVWFLGVRTGEPLVATMTRAIRKDAAAFAVPVRATSAPQALTVLILTVLIGLLNQAAWMPVT